MQMPTETSGLGEDDVLRGALLRDKGEREREARRTKPGNNQAENSSCRCLSLEPKQGKGKGGKKGRSMVNSAREGGHYFGAAVSLESTINTNSEGMELYFSDDHGAPSPPESLMVLLIMLLLLLLLLLTTAATVAAVHHAAFKLLWGWAAMPVSAARQVGGGT